MAKWCKVLTVARDVARGYTVLTVARGVASAGGQAGWAGYPLPHTVAHVAARGGHQVVGHPARAVPHLHKSSFSRYSRYTVVAEIAARGSLQK